jgi:hypothetical protein
MQVLKASEVATLCLLGMALGVVEPCAADPRAFRPTEDSPTQQIGKNLGNLSPGGSGYQSSSRLNRSDSVASVAPRNFSQTGRRASGYGAWDAPLRGTSSRGGLFSRETRRDNSLLPPDLGSARLFPELNRKKPGLLLRDGGVYAEDLPDIAIRDPAASRPAEEMEEAARRPVQLDDLARDYIATHRTSYIDQAWQSFARGQYRVAGDYFSLARSLSFDYPAIRADIEIGSMASSIGSGQYSSAVRSLQWLLTPDRRSGDLPDPSFVEKLPRLSDRYGDKEQFKEHGRKVEAEANANPTVPILLALRCVVLWERGDQAGAKFYAKNLGDTNPEPWPRLSQVMERASSGTSSEANVTSRPADYARPLLPSDLVARQK